MRRIGFMGLFDGCGRKGPRKPNWREAERYFRQERDGKIPVTLPRLAFMDDTGVTEEFQVAG